MTLPGLRNIEAAKQLLRTDLAVRSDYGLEILQNASLFNKLNGYKIHICSSEKESIRRSASFSPT